MFSERGFPGKPRTHAPVRFLSRLASVFCFCVSFMFYVSRNQDPREADKDKVSLQFYLISSKTLTTGQLAGLARTPQPLTAHSHRS